MSSPIATATIQAAILSAISNVLAQTISSYRHDKPFNLDMRPILQFVLYSLISSPPNYIWQETLEEWFPGHPTSAKDTRISEKKDSAKPAEPPLSYANVAKKFITDQCIGAPLNTLAFILCVKGMKSGASVDQVVAGLQKDFIPLHLTSLKLWPAVGLISLIFVPVERRIVFGAMIGLLWNVYLGLILS